MTKIIYNACYGGFSISLEAALRGREISNNPKWGGVLQGEAYPDGEIRTMGHGYGREIPRNDSTLVQVFEELGCHRASGGFANLQLRELPAGIKYRIDEYDGYESVMTIDEYEWEVA